MSEEEKNGTDQSTDVAQERLDDIQNKAISKGANKGGKAVGKAIGKAVQAGAKAIAKGVAYAVKAIITVVGPYLLAIIGVIVLCAIIYDFFFETRGKEQAYQGQEVAEDNVIKKNGQGEYEAIGLSKGNKLVKAFYTYFADQSYFITIGDDYKKVYNPKDEYITKNNIKDKYEREKMFYLNPNALWTLDEFLNNNQFRFPEQFVKSVPYDPDTFELKQLADDNGKLLVQSQKYDLVTKEPIIGQKVDGIWDYGFAPILHYQKMKEMKEIEGKYTKQEYWDPVSAGSLEGKSPEEQISAQFKTKPIDDNYYKVVPGYPKTVYMIDKVVTSAGNITNNITAEKTKGDVYNDSEVYEEKTVDIYGYVDHEVTKTRKVNKTRNVEKTRTVTKTRQVESTCYLFEGTFFEIKYPCTVTETYEEEETYTDTEPYTVTETYTETETKWEKTGTHTVKLRKYIEANYYETIPQYSGQPDTSQITGNKYFKDYFTNYTTYVPEKVMTEFNFKDRTGKDEEALNKLIEADEVPSADGTGSTGTGGKVDVAQFQLGSGASSDSYKRALQYLPIFQKWGQAYGVDPYLLVAKASQESSGNHESSTNAERCAIAGCGLMQVEKPGQVITSVSAFNFNTKSKETVTINSWLDVQNVDDNIRVGTMEFASRLKGMNYNILLSIQAYNYGPGGIGSVLKLYSQETGKAIDQIKSDTTDMGWLKWRQEVHQNPSKYFSWNSGTYGDPLYVEHVLRYYASPDDKAPYIVKEDGTKVVADGNIQTGFASGVSVSGGSWGDKFTSWIREKFQQIKDNWEKLFPEKKDLPRQRVAFTNNIPGNRTQDIVNMMFVMEEKKYFSEYGDMTDQVWKEKFAQLFSNPIGAYWTPEFSINTLDYFPKGFEPPVRIAPVISKGFGNAINGGNTELHRGVDVVAPAGTPIYAVSDGEVTELDDVSIGSGLGKNLVIKHSASISTGYGNLDTITVKKGDKVIKGQQIGTAGNTGADQGYVLHFELIKDGEKIDGSWVVTGQNVNQVASGPMSIEGSQKAQQIYAKMKDYLGSWYAWGGTTPPKKVNGVWEQPRGTGRFIAGEEVTTPGFDCSGLMQWGFNQVGISIPRTSQEQQRQSKVVSKSDAQPGDLIFFGSPAYHVGMFIGNGQYIHSPQTGKPITISQVNWSRVTSVGRFIP